MQVGNRVRLKGDAEFPEEYGILKDYNASFAYVVVEDEYRTKLDDGWREVPIEQVEEIN